MEKSSCFIRRVIDSLYYNLFTQHLRTMSFIRHDKLFIIRKATIFDIPKLVEIEKDAYLGEIPWVGSIFFMELTSPVPHNYFVVEYQKTIVGFIGCRYEEGEGHITNVAIHSLYHRLGLASELFNSVVLEATKQKCTALSLEVRVSNKQAQNLYYKLGFVTRAVKEGYYIEENEDAFDMICQLSRYQYQ